ncbi:hypothetical protein [Campylobacter phage CJLB-14]|nr:hypothetical protein [Campylobacter phage CJLB-14]
MLLLLEYITTLHIIELLIYSKSILEMLTSVHYGLTLALNN